jgi:hypothetical protein
MLSWRDFLLTQAGWAYLFLVVSPVYIIILQNRYWGIFYFFSSRIHSLKTEFLNNLIIARNL